MTRDPRATTGRPAYGGPVPGDRRESKGRKLGRPVKVAVLCSHRAPGLVQLLNRDPHRGADYEVVCCVTSSDTFAEEVRVERRGVPCLPHSIRRYSLSRGTAVSDLEARPDYDRITLELLKPFNPDVILLDDYLLVLTAPILDAFDGRVLNIHHADLTVRDGDGAPKYVGLSAVRDALLAGECETRATTHMVTEQVDNGPVMLRSWPFPVPPVAEWARDRNAGDVLRAAAWAQREWMLREAWGPMLTRTVELVSRAIEDPKRPLNISTLGRWTLEPDGTLTPDEPLVGV